MEVRLITATYARLTMKRTLFLIFLILVSVAIAFAQNTGVKKKRPLPDQFGRVVISNFSEKAGLAPVVFDHWFHRSRFTCRLCHVDLAFGMKAGTTGIRAADNMRGFYCGTCHNGKMAFEDRKVFKACADKYSGDDVPICERCHSLGKNVKKEHDFDSFAARLPKEGFGNGIDWEKAEEQGLIKPINFIEGVSIRRPSLTIQKDFLLEPKVTGMPEIVFSHKKHSVWNGCELCHPEIFVGVKKGQTKYSMPEIIEGKYCGVCHIAVAFPLIDCQRCHVKAVQ
jgi:c(7)-type cytochrome triheme protein